MEWRTKNVGRRECICYFKFSILIHHMHLGIAWVCRSLMLLAIYNVLSLQALLHASVSHGKKLFVDWVPASDLEDATSKEVVINFVFLTLYVILIFTLFLNMTKISCCRIQMLIKLLGSCWRLVYLMSLDYQADNAILIYSGGVYPLLSCSNFFDLVSD